MDSECIFQATAITQWAVGTLHSANYWNPGWNGPDECLQSCEQNSTQVWSCQVSTTESLRFSGYFGIYANREHSLEAEGLLVLSQYEHLDHYLIVTYYVVCDSLLIIHFKKTSTDYYLIYSNTLCDRLIPGLYVVPSANSGLSKRVCDHFCFNKMCMSCKCGVQKIK